MGRATDLTVIEKSKIIGMRQEGFSFSKISLAVGRSVNAVKHVIGNFTETEVIGKREVTKLVKRKISDRTARYLQLLSKRDRRKTLPVLTQEISLATSNKISLSSVRRSLQSFGMSGRVACKKTLLRRANIRKRLEFAKQHLNWSEDQ